MSGQRMPCHLSPSHQLQRVSASCCPPPRSLLPKRGLGGVKHWDAREGSCCSPTAVPGFHSRCLLWWLPRTARGPGRPRPQPGGLAPLPLPGLAARPARQTLHPHTCQRRWLGFGGTRVRSPSRNDAASLTSHWPACHIRASG